MVAALRTAITALLAGVALVLIFRRLAGALGPPEPFTLVGASLVLAALAALVHGTGQKPGGAANVWASAAVAGSAASLSAGGGQPFSLLAFWAVILFEEIWAWRRAATVRLAKTHDPAAEPSPADAHDFSKEGEEPPEPAADVVQQLTLRASAEGGQELSGWLRLALAAGQQTGSLHVAFCPAFERPPQVQAEAVSGPDCRIKTAQVLPYGARLDVKLDEAMEQGDNLLVWFTASGAALDG